jgi:small subunit ribosomal protein S6
VSEESTSRFYEMMVITSPEGTPEELVETVEQITGYITTAGGTIIRVNYDSPWGRRRLSYPIRFESQDVRDGFYTLFHFELEPTAVTEIERDLKLNTRLMRYLVLVLPEMPTFPEPEVEEAAPSDGEGSTDGETAVDGEAPASGGPAEATEPAVDEAAAADTPDEEAASASEDTETHSESDPEGSAASRRGTVPDSDEASDDVASADDPEAGTEVSKEG